MVQFRVNGLPVLGLFALLLWAGNTHAVPCHDNIPASNPNWVYTDHGNGTVTDTRTGLMWKQCAEGLSGATCQTGSAQTFTWANALAQAEASTFANHTDWRLPNVKELSSLVEECRIKPTINTNVFPNTPTSSSSWFWSGSPDANNPFFAWYLHFWYGTTYYWAYRTESGNVRLVRGGQ